MSFTPNNVGALDRAARVGLGMLLLGLAATGSIGPWGYAGAIPLLTGAAGICPLYSLLGFSTCGRRRR